MRKTHLIIVLTATLSGAITSCSTSETIGSTDAQSNGISVQDSIAPIPQHTFANPPAKKEVVRKEENK
jgi:predicted small secreted protein